MKKITLNNGRYTLKKGDRLMVVESCTCEKDLYEWAHHYIEDLDCKTLFNGEIVEYVNCYTNLYGTFVNCIFKGEIYNLVPTNLEFYED